MADNILKQGIINPYTVTPKNLTQYTAYRGVTDFTQIGQFDQFEQGYQFLSVIKMPTFIEKAAEIDQDIAALCFSWKHAVENEFRGLTGLPDIQGNPGTITDGINEVQFINRVTMDTSISVDMSYFEKRGQLFTKFAEYYLTGIKDRMTQAKTYHGLIRNGILEPGLENEVFTLLYYVTDNTMLQLERAVLLTNAQLTMAPTGQLYSANRSDIGNNPEVTLTFNCFPIMSLQVDKAASVLLQDINGVRIGAEDGAEKYHNEVDEGTLIGTETFGSLSKNKYISNLDSNDYLYGIMNKDTSTAAQIPELTDAIDAANVY